jgi:protein-S-isoprenylcysteine O-methyltransferase Ste14
VTPLDFFACYRVRLGYLLALLALWLARPTVTSILAGAAVGIVGLGIRAYAAGYLHKQEVLTVTGPYSRTRNPLYFGSSILAAGAAIAMHSWWAAGLLLLYFALVYSFVMRREEMELRHRYSVAFDAYAAAVPLFLPRLTAASTGVTAKGSFSWRQYRKNHEYQAAIGFLFLLAVLVVIWRLRLP